jgi:hypothetical protein
LRLPSQQQNVRAPGVAVVRMLTGVGVIHVFLVANSNVFGALMQKLFKSDISSTPDLAA